MTDIQGALGVSQMKKARMILDSRRRIAVRYSEALKDVNFLITPFVPENYINGYQSYVCLFANDEIISNLNIDKIKKLNIDRNRIMSVLEEKGIATRQGTHAVHTLGYYKNKYKLSEADFIMSYAADRLSITLPLYADITDEEFDYVVSEIKHIFNK